MNEKAKCKNCTDEMIEDMCKNFKCCVGCDMFNGYVDSYGELKNASCIEYPASHCLECYISTNQAKVLYNVGYRKIPEGSVVLSKEEYQQHRKWLREAEEQNLNRARKETAKEIFEKVLSYIGSNQKFCIVDNDNQTLIDCDKLWEFVGILAKQFGVEVEVEE